MIHDPYPIFQHLTQTQLGKLFGVTSHQVGKWLAELNLRQIGGGPTPKAEEAGLVQAVSQDDVRFFVWDKERVVKLLEKVGHKRLVPEASPEPPTSPPIIEGKLVGPFTHRRSDDGGDGLEIVGDDGIVGVWVRGERNAQVIVKLLNLAHEHGKL